MYVNKINTNIDKNWFYMPINESILTFVTSNTVVTFTSILYLHYPQKYFYCFIRKNTEIVLPTAQSNHFLLFFFKNLSFLVHYVWWSIVTRIGHKSINCQPCQLSVISVINLHQHWKTIMTDVFHINKHSHFAPILICQVSMKFKHTKNVKPKRTPMKQG